MLPLSDASRRTLHFPVMTMLITAQVFSEVGSVATTQMGGVAYMAHIGGFVFGLLLNRVFETGERRRDEGVELRH